MVTILLKNDTLKTTLDLKHNKNLYKKIEEIGRKYNFRISENLFFFNPERKEILIIKNKEVLFFNTDYKLIKKINTFLSNIYRYKVNNSGLLYNEIFYYGLENGVLFIDFKTKTTKYISFKELVGVESIKYIRVKGLKDEIQISFPGHLLTFNYNLELKKSYSFPEKLGRMSYKDSKGNIWLGDFANGVSLIPSSQTKTSYLLENKKVQKINKIDSVFYAGVNDEGFYQLK